MAARRPWVEIGVGLLGGLLGACLGGTGHPIETCRIKMRQLQGDLEIYAVKHKGQYPATLDEVARQPVDRLDVWGTPFVYSVRPDGRGYVLLSLGADRRPEGEGEGADLVDWGGRDSIAPP